VLQLKHKAEELGVSRRQVKARGKVKAEVEGDRCCSAEVQKTRYQARRSGSF
jgi:hypothetical protein